MATYLEYMDAAMRRAEYELTEEEGEWYAHIPGLKGLWATGGTIEDTRKELLSALDGWLHVNAYLGRQRLPDFDGVNMLEPPQKVE
jgi:predicted RNase H-like HicB family nuclease